MNNGKQKKALNIIIILIFFGLIWLPNIDSVFNVVPNLTNSEKRTLSKLPELKMNRKSIANFHSKFVKYFIDNFGLRNVLIRWNSLLKLKLLKVDRFPKVVIGKNDWLYLIRTDERVSTLDYYRRIKIFDEMSIKVWAEPFIDVQKKLSKMGIEFALVFVPVKHNIYPEYIPEHLKPVRDISRLDQLKEYFAKHTDVHVIDLSDAVRKAKARFPVYYKHDVHWNFYGSFFGYRKLMEDLSIYYPDVNILKLNDYEVKEDKLVGGDLASMLSLKDLFTEVNYLQVPKYKSKVRKMQLDYKVKSSRYSDLHVNENTSLPKALVFHDSFFNFIKPHFNEHFSRIACFQSYDRLDFSVIEREKPDIVIFEMSESYTQRSPVYLAPLNFPK